MERNILQDVKIEDMLTKEAGLIFSKGASVVSIKNQFNLLGYVTDIPKRCNNSPTKCLSSDHALLDPTEYAEVVLSSTRGIYWIITSDA
mmetsp:Transcript_8888/g.10920  ORF Transcript_8888/g.10920 Transcript_8888/m.10920 type:complete len:89 (+) Transcript_8888:2270-2536(+)